MQHQLPAHQGNVIGRRHMDLCREAAGIFEHSIRHAKLRRPLVHPLHKGLLTAGDVLRQCHGAIVGGHHAHGLEHFVHRKLLPLLQPDLTAAHRAGVR